MAKTVISRNFRYPSAELRERVRTAVKERGFRSEQAFLIAACEHELREGDNTEATAQLEARIAAILANMAKEVQSLFTLGHTQFALTNSPKPRHKGVIAFWSQSPYRGPPRPSAMFR